MDGEINKIEVRLSEDESMMYRDCVYDGTCEKEIFLVKVRLVVMNWRSEEHTSELQSPS